MLPSLAGKQRLPGILVALACLLVLAHEPRIEQASSIRDATAAIAKGADTNGRRQAIVDRLEGDRR